jgi:hypothetical protein
MIQDTWIPPAYDPFGAIPGVMQHSGSVFLYMKKFIAAAIAALLVIGFVGTVSAAQPAKGINGKGEAEHLYLFEKNPSDWSIVDGGAWGKMTFKVRDYTPAPEMFVFNGHQVEMGTEYSLIYYPDPWPGTGLMVLGTGTSDEFGDVHIAGEFDFDAIPIDGDENGAIENGGAKIWLVLSGDTDGTQMTGWNPTGYLFEYQLI